MAEIEMIGVSKRYPDGPEAVASVDLAVADGELAVLVGPSGCGKSTTLRLIAGLESVTAGRILIAGRDVTALPPRERDVAMVFQSYALYPTKTVRENLAFPLRMRRLPQREIEERVARAAEELGLTDLVDRRPGALSGGQRQRVALGRALVREPNAFLLDEPLSNLDARLRVRTRARIARLHRRLGATMVYVTHDQEEAMTLGDRIAVMDGGRIRQFAPPRTVYREPADTFVAAFVGSPEMNLLPAFRRDGALVLAGTRIELPSPPGRDGEPVTVGIRPPDVDVVPEDRADLIAVVDVVEPLGSHVLVHAGLAGGEEFRLLTGPDDAPVEGKRLGLALRRRSLHFFDATTGLRVAPASRAGA